MWSLILDIALCISCLICGIVDIINNSLLGGVIMILCSLLWAINTYLELKKRK